MRSIGNSTNHYSELKILLKLNQWCGHSTVNHCEHAKREEEAVPTILEDSYYLWIVPY